MKSDPLPTEKQRELLYDVILAAFRWEMFRGMLATYQRKWRDADRQGGPDYLAMLNHVETHDA